MRRRRFGLEPAHTEVDGDRVRELRAGAATSLPELVLLPGLGAPGYLAPLAREVGRWTSATILDLPGWRAGRPRAAEPTIAGIARVTAAWLAARGGGPVVLLGHSTGAQAAARVAVMVPGCLVGVVLAGPTFDPAARLPRGAATRIARTLPYEVVGEILAVAPSYLASGMLPLWRMLRDGQADRIEDVVGRIRVPRLVVTGEHDGVAPPAWARSLADRAGAAFVVLPGGHNAPYRHPGTTSRALERAVRSWTAA